MQFQRIYIPICLAVVLLSFSVMLVTGCGIAPEPPVVDEPGEESSSSNDLTKLKKLEPGTYLQTLQMPDGRVVSFTIAIPTTYTDDKQWPMVLSLHYGARQIRQFFSSDMVNGLVVPAVDDLDPIVIAPDVMNKSWLDARCEEAVLYLFGQALKTYNINRKQVLVVGYSMGAEGAWYYAGAHPDKFTAAIPIAGRPLPNYQDYEWTVPMLVIHSRTDEVYPFARTEEVANQIGAETGYVQVYALDGANHYESNKYIEPLKEGVRWVMQVWDSLENNDGGSP